MPCICQWTLSIRNRNLSPLLSPPQIGGSGDVVTMVLSNGLYTFQSAPCTIRVPSIAVRCLAPPGVGASHTVTLVVDGIASAPFPNRTVSYAPPTLTSVEVLSGAGASVDAVGTAGGSMVALRGLVRRFLLCPACQCAPLEASVPTLAALLIRLSSPHPLSSELWVQPSEPPFLGPGDVQSRRVHASQWRQGTRSLFLSLSYQSSGITNTCPPHTSVLHVVWVPLFGESRLSHAPCSPCA
jgi:hypothetical protein